MNPILFAKNATTFNTNGLGRLECLECFVTEARNGIYELEALIPVSGKHASDVEMDSIIGVIPSDGGTMQGFRVYEITKPMNGRFKVSARHISYQLLNVPSMPFSITASPSACSQTLAGLKSHAADTCPFTFWTNVTTGASYTQTVPAAIRTRLLGTEGSVLDQFGGEYEWDNWTVKLHNKRGRVAEANGITLRYGKNITDLEQEENISNVVTGVVPYWADNDGHLVTLTEKVVYSAYADRYPFKRTEVLDLSTKWENQPSEATLRSAAQAYVNNTELGIPKVSIKVSFVALWQSEEYKDVLPLQRVKLCDEITVIFEKYGISRVAKVVKTVYNVLKEKYDSIEVGDIRSTFTSTLNNQQASTIQTIAEQAVATNTAINNATKWLTTAGGYVIAIKHTDGTWKELVFASQTDLTASNTKILRINNNGIGFSKTGINGPYTQAWTIDGNLVADFIHGGTLTLGGNGNGNGWLKIVAANGTTQIGKWDVNGIEITNGSIHLGTGTTVGGVTVYPFSVSNAGELRAISGTIGGFTLGSTYIKSGKDSLSDAKDGIYMGADGIALGKNSTFKVTNAGELYAKSGKFGTNQTFEITGNGLHSINGPTAAYGQTAVGTYVGSDGLCVNGGTSHVWISAGSITSDGNVISKTLQARNSLAIGGADSNASVQVVQDNQTYTGVSTIISWTDPLGNGHALNIRNGIVVYAS